MRLDRGTVGILALVLAAATMILGAWLMMRGATSHDATPRRDGLPAELAQNPRAAREAVLRQTCQAQCASDDQLCRGVASEPAALAACAETRGRCEHACP